MLSYRHAFHAGNHADVLKHFVTISKDMAWCPGKGCSNACAVEANELKLMSNVFSWVRVLTERGTCVNCYSFWLRQGNDRVQILRAN